MAVTCERRTFRRTLLLATALLALSCRSATSPPGAATPSPQDASPTRPAASGEIGADRVLHWAPPPGFSPERPDLGFPSLRGSERLTLRPMRNVLLDELRTSGADCQLLTDLAAADKTRLLQQVEQFKTQRDSMASESTF